MVKIKYRMDATQVKAGLEALGAEAPRATMRAINRTLDSVQTQAVRGIAQDLGVIQRVVRETLRIYRATRASLRGSLQARGKRIALMDFKARQTRAGVSYTMQGTRKVAAHTFIAKMRSGHTGVFMRKGAKRLPVKELFGPSVPHVFRKHITAALRQYAAEALAKNLNHEVAFLLLKK